MSTQPSTGRVRWTPSLLGWRKIGLMKSDWDNYTTSPVDIAPGTAVHIVILPELARVAT